jgi:hypothetical protein
MKSKCAVSHGSSWTANFCDEGGDGLILCEKEKLSLKGYDEPPLILVFMLKHSLKVLMWRVLSDFVDFMILIYQQM